MPFHRLGTTVEHSEKQARMSSIISVLTHERGLQDVHREHPELLLVAAVGRELAALAEEDDVVDAVPRSDQARRRRVETPEVWSAESVVKSRACVVLDGHSSNVLVAIVE
jgi:hypothetical protein